MTGDFLKPVLLLVPHYMGSLLYFEKLLLGLSEKYEVVFFPLFEKLAVEKIISVNDNSIYVRWLITEGNKRGIDTMVLQWALFYEGQRLRPPRLVKNWRRIFYKFGKPVYLFFRKIFRGLILGFDFEGGKFVIGAGPSKRMGVINSAAKDCFVQAGVPEKKISIVGHPDFYLAEEVMKNLGSSSLEKITVADKYGIDLSKKNVVFYSSPMYVKDITVLTPAEQLDYTKRLFTIIRKYLTEKNYDLILKIHPLEKADLYRPVEELGVKIMKKQTNNNELIFFADLYIADSTFTNFIPIAMGKEAIFVNFFNLPSVESAKGCFGIKKFIEAWDEFEKLLELFRDGNLPRQYEFDAKILINNSLRKILDWIG